MARTLLLYTLVVVSSSFGQEYYPLQTPVFPVGGKGPPAACRNEIGQPQRCIPEFENAAFGVKMEATNTCGDNGTTRYCIQTSAGTDERICDECVKDQFSSNYLTDLHHDSENQTWWQSDTMKEGIRYPNMVNLTLHLGKAYDITYIRIVFYSPRPQSFVIYKRVNEDSEWVPYQYYSQSCRETYGLPESKAADISAETRSLCTSEYSDISPLKGGNVLFSTLEGRPSAFSFDSSPQLQEWVTATDIRISLNRLNTFGDEIFEDEQVLRSYWYAIADVAVGARCKCNGHASRCENDYDVNGRRSRVCRCEHNTAGRDCERCLDFYNDAPWGRASQTNVHECRPCNCNGFSDRCLFDKELYERTGHGGHCVECMENRDGPNCERCRDNFYQRADGTCVACNCDPTGSRSLQCSSDGKCQCKPGVSGEKCSTCSSNYYEFTTQGCKPCSCFEMGSVSNKPRCDPISGMCQCKENVEGKRCGQCKPGFFNLDLKNQFGCTPCFCHGHSSQCNSAPDYAAIQIESKFARNAERWGAQDQLHVARDLRYNTTLKHIAVAAEGNEPVYFVAPDRFLGDQRASYNHDLRFRLRLGEPAGYTSQADLVLEGLGRYVAINLFGQNNLPPTNQGVDYTFRLHESPHYGWSPTLSTIDFMSILSNLTAIKIRGTYNRNGVGYLEQFQLQTAQRGVSGEPALWVEMCSCPRGYVGQFCESCDPGYRHSPANGGPFTMCIPCDCNHHASICDSETGMCICEHNTAGDNCELCAKGYYGNAVSGTVDDCKPCPCPNRSACIQMMDQSIVCTECPTGYAGIKCDLCSDGNFGDPMGRYGEPTPCTACDCNGNVDLNAVGNCNRTTGECLKCIYNTAGDHCDRCLNGYYGDALSATKGDCRPCECYQEGTLESEEGPPQCNPLTGFCACRPHVTGRNCDKCQPGYFNIQSRDGCEACNCNFEGSYNNTCDPVSGQCYCKPGVDGLHCDQCKAYHYGFSVEGCQYCDCDESGATNYQCSASGQCSCQENVEGRRCDRCMENKQRRSDLAGCEDCPPCYNLVQDAVNQHRRDLDELTQMLSKISASKTVVKSADFDGELERVRAELEALRRAAEGAGAGAGGAAGAEPPLPERLRDLDQRLRRVRELLLEVEESLKAADLSTAESQGSIKQADEIIESARREFTSAEEYLAGEGASALAKAQNRSEQFGQQSTRMSRVAQESRLLAEKLERDAAKVKGTAESAYNASLAANALARDGMTKQNSIRAELQILESEMRAAAGKLSNVRDVAQQARNRSGDVYDAALDAYVQVNSTQLPAVDAASLQNNATLLIKKADELQEMIDQLSEQYDESLDELDQQISLGRSLKDQGQDREAEIQEIIARLDDIKGRALEAVAETNSTLQDAYKIHNTLKNFSMQVHASREAAEAESRGVPAIEEALARAGSARRELDSLLAAAAATARDAREHAARARAQLEERAARAAALRRDAAAARTDAFELRDEATKLAGRVDQTAQQIDSLNKTAEENGVATSDANIKVASAKKDAEEAQRLVRKATDELRAIQDELQNVQALDDDALDNLQRNLERAEKELEAANLAAKIETLQAAKSIHLKSLKEYQENAALLESQVNNVKDIMEALPVGCFKKVILEPS